MILLGLTGSVASVLAHKLVQELKNVDLQIEVVVTRAALPFIDEYALSKCVNRLYVEDDEWVWWREGGVQHKWKKNDPVLHIELSKRADMFLIAPITANTMGKLANGLCDNLLTSIARAWDAREKPLLIAPAMNTMMWSHIITTKHLETLGGFNYKIISPQSKVLACGDEGMGALADISTIVGWAAGEVYECPYDKWWFPLDYATGVPVNPHPGAFGYDRKGHRHTGIDLYTKDGEAVCAVEPGKVVCIEHFTGEWDNSPWWNNTDCVLVEGKSGVICYGEVTPHENLKVGDFVRLGAHIANVKRVIKEGREHPEITGHMPSMLHMELYPAGTMHPSSGFSDLLRDPTPFLLDSYSQFRIHENKLVYADYNPK
jgi:phosphopantothenoylcysteine decarboxylase